MFRNLTGGVVFLLIFSLIADPVTASAVSPFSSFKSVSTVSNSQKTVFYRQALVAAGVPYRALRRITGPELFDRSWLDPLKRIWTPQERPLPPSKPPSPERETRTSFLRPAFGSVGAIVLAAVMAIASTAHAAAQQTIAYVTTVVTVPIINTAPSFTRLAVKTASKHIAASDNTSTLSHVLTAHHIPATDANFQLVQQFNDMLHTGAIRTIGNQAYQLISGAKLALPFDPIATPSVTLQQNITQQILHIVPLPARELTSAEQFLLWGHDVLHLAMDSHWIVAIAALSIAALVALVVVGGRLRRPAVGTGVPPAKKTNVATGKVTDVSAEEKLAARLAQRLNTLQWRLGDPESITRDAYETFATEHAELKAEIERYRGPFPVFQALVPTLDAIQRSLNAAHAHLLAQGVEVQGTEEKVLTPYEKEITRLLAATASPDTLTKEQWTTWVVAYYDLNQNYASYGNLAGVEENLALISERLQAAEARLFPGVKTVKGAPKAGTARARLPMTLATPEEEHVAALEPRPLPPTEPRGVPRVHTTESDILEDGPLRLFLAEDGVRQSVPVAPFSSLEDRRGAEVARLSMEFGVPIAQSHAPESPVRPISSRSPLLLPADTATSLEAIATASAQQAVHDVVGMPFSMTGTQPDKEGEYLIDALGVPRIPTAAVPVDRVAAPTPAPVTVAVEVVTTAAQEIVTLSISELDQIAHLLHRLGQPTSQNPTSGSNPQASLTDTPAPAQTLDPTHPLFHIELIRLAQQYQNGNPLPEVQEAREKLDSLGIKWSRDLIKALARRDPRYREVMAALGMELPTEAPQPEPPASPSAGVPTAGSADQGTFTDQEIGLAREAIAGDGLAGGILDARGLIWQPYFLIPEARKGNQRVQSLCEQLGIDWQQEFVLIRFGRGILKWFQSDLPPIKRDPIPSTLVPDAPPSQHVVPDAEAVDAAGIAATVTPEGTATNPGATPDAEVPAGETASAPTPLTSVDFWKEFTVIQTNLSRIKDYDRIAYQYKIHKDRWEALLAKFDAVLTMEDKVKAETIKNERLAYHRSLLTPKEKVKLNSLIPGLEAEDHSKTDPKDPPEGGAAGLNPPPPPPTSSAFAPALVTAPMSLVDLAVAFSERQKLIHADVERIKRGKGPLALERFAEHQAQYDALLSHLKLYPGALIPDQSEALNALNDYKVLIAADVKLSIPKLMPLIRVIIGLNHIDPNTLTTHTPEEWAVGVNNSIEEAFTTFAITRHHRAVLLRPLVQPVDDALYDRRTESDIPLAFSALLDMRRAVDLSHRMVRLHLMIDPNTISVSELARRREEFSRITSHLRSLQPDWPSLRTRLSVYMNKISEKIAAAEKDLGVADEKIATGKVSPQGDAARGGVGLGDSVPAGVTHRGITTVGIAGLLLLGYSLFGASSAEAFTGVAASLSSDSAHLSLVRVFFVFAAGAFLGFSPRLSNSGSNGKNLNGSRASVLSLTVSMVLVMVGPIFVDAFSKLLFDFSPLDFISTLQNPFNDIPKNWTFPIFLQISLTDVLLLLGSVTAGFLGIRHWIRPSNIIPKTSQPDSTTLLSPMSAPPTIGQTFDTIIASVGNGEQTPVVSFKDLETQLNKALNDALLHGLRGVAVIDARKRISKAKSAFIKSLSSKAQAQIRDYQQQEAGHVATVLSGFRKRPVGVKDLPGRRSSSGSVDDKGSRSRPADSSSDSSKEGSGVNAVVDPLTLLLAVTLLVPQEYITAVWAGGIIAMSIIGGIFMLSRRWIQNPKNPQRLFSSRSSSFRRFAYAA